MLVYISLFLFIILIAIGIYKQKGIPECISDIYYNIGYWFTFLLGSASFILMPYIIDITPEAYKFTGFLCCGALMFVAFAPHYKDIFEGKVHMCGAIISAICATIWTICTQPWCLLCGIIGILGTLIKKKNWMFWFELSCFIMIYLTLLII